jgi:hypothetical protein
MTVIMYGMSSSIYTHLWNIHQGKVSKTTFTYYDNPPFSREMYFLRDAGYIRPSPGRDFLDFNTNMQGQDLASICELTPIGEIVVEIRGTPARVGRC